MSRSTSTASRVPRAEVVALVAMLLLAAFLRLHDLDSAPPGLTHDEADHGRDAARVLEGIRPIYFTVGYGREPLYDYTTALVMLAAGPTYYASRLTSAFFGLLLLPLTWAWARRALGAGVGLLAAAFIAVDFWPVMVSRQALRSVTLPALLTAAAYCWWRFSECGPLNPAPGSRGARLKWAVAAGVLLGGTFYTYLAARVTWVIFPALMAYLALFRRDRLCRPWRYMALSLLIAALVSAPLFGWLLANPGAESRIGDLSYPLERAAAGNFEPLLTHVVAALGMFNLRSDSLWMYNLPGLPLLGVAQGVLFLGGLLLASVGALRRRPAAAFLLIWLAAGMVPNLITGVDAASTRAVGLMPAAYVLAAWAFVAVGRWVNATGIESTWRKFHLPLVPVAALLVALSGWATYRNYFELWTPARDVRVAYHHTLVETVAYLDAGADAAPVMWSSIAPEAPHDPAVVRMTLRRDDLTVRWFDTRRALLFPDEDRVRVILPEVTRLNGSLQSYFTGAAVVERLALPPTDFNRTVDIYEWNPRAALGTLVPTLSREAAATVDPGAPLDEPALALLGYDLAAPDTLVTFWRALAAYGPEETDGVVLFVHVVDETGQMVVQEDRLDAPAWTWHPGDAFAQVHEFESVDLRAYSVYVGAYDRDTHTRLTLDVGGEHGHRVRLGALEAGE